MNDSSVSNTGLIFDVDVDNLRSEVLEASQNIPKGHLLGGVVPILQKPAAYFEQVGTEYAGKFRVARLNVEDTDPRVQALAQQLIGQLGIRSIPATVLIHEGKPVQVLPGLQGEQS